MSAVRHYRDDAPEALRQQIDDFIFQESTHSREHVFFNRQARDAGYDLTSSEERAARTIAWAKRCPPLMQLAGTCALEHFTATLANAILSDPAHLAGADAEAQRMWRWHAIEEIEHKAVAYDTLLLAIRDRPRFRRWTLRSFTMLAAGVRFLSSFATPPTCCGRTGRTIFGRGGSFSPISMQAGPDAALAARRLHLFPSELPSGAA